MADDTPGNNAQAVEETVLRFVTGYAGNWKITSAAGIAHRYSTKVSPSP